MDIKYFFTSIFFISIFHSGFSQISLGVKAGPQFSVLTSKHADDNYYQLKLSYHAGGVLKYSFSEKIGGQAEVLYSKKGYRTKARTNPNLSGAKVNFHYLTLPLLFVYQPVKKLGLELGPEIGYMLDATSSFDGRAVDISHIWERKFDMGIILGISYNFTSAIQVSARYNYGLLPLMEHELIDENQVSQGTIKDIYNRVLLLSVSYSFIKNE